MVNRKINVTSFLRMTKNIWLWLIVCSLATPILSQNSVFDNLPEDTKFGSFAVRIAPEKKLPIGIIHNYSANGWDYILCDQEQLLNALKEGCFEQIYTDPGRAYALNDSSVVTHSANLVHDGHGDLINGFTGKGVIIGYVDTGCDITHGDFKDEQGNSRVIRYWDQTASVNARTPSKYGYGQVYDSSDINAGILPNYAGSGHGTTVTGSGSGNGLANGRNKGIAPESDIIVIKNPISGANFTIMVAEAVDYVFAVADSLGMPAVVNLSLGTYLGSHDGLDPAGLYIDSLINEKPGRIVVCAAGNSGNWGKYHVRGEITPDTSFTWLIPNPSLAFGSPGIYFDLWADTSDISTMSFAVGADAPIPMFRGRTDFKETGALYNIDQYDALTVDGNLIANIVYNERVIGPNYNLRLLAFTDSLDYRIRFMTTGTSGKYDMWSGTNLGLSNFESTIPDPLLYADFQHYLFPDSLQSIVSSWACSPQVITVANMQNRQNYIDFSGNVFPADGGQIPAGQLSVNSSKGPNRRDQLKPDITAAGDLTLSARVMNEAYSPSQLDEGGLHVRNGGTSMASPVIAGIAALYLEKCRHSTWQDFKTDLYSGAFVDHFVTDTVPNYAFGMGKANAYSTLIESNYSAKVEGDTLLCNQEGTLYIDPSPIQIEWNTGETNYPLNVFETNNYSALVMNSQGCITHTDTLSVVAGSTPFPSIISQLDGALIATANDNYQWLLNGEPIIGATEQTYFPTEGGTFSVQVTHSSGCTAISNDLYISLLGLNSNEEQVVRIYPNPAQLFITLSTENSGEYEVIQVDGKIVLHGYYNNTTIIDVHELSNGLYFINLYEENGHFETKFVKN